MQPAIMISLSRRVDAASPGSTRQKTCPPPTMCASRMNMHQGTHFGRAQSELTDFCMCWNIRLKGMPLAPPLAVVWSWLVHFTWKRDTARVRMHVMLLSRPMSRFRLWYLAACPAP